MTDLAVHRDGVVVALVDRDYRVTFPSSSIPDRLGELDVSSRIAVSVRPVHPGVVRSYLGSLLPEVGTRSRSRIARRASTYDGDVVGILAVSGSDTPGALVFAPAGEDLPEPSYTPLSDAEVVEYLGDGDHDHGGSSLPGVQPKGALALLEGAWHRPRGTGASTHILKPTITAVPEVVHDEALSSRAALAVGLDSAVSTVEGFEGLDVLVVPRYDRVVEGRVVRRSHQEDGAAAIGITPDEVNAKFEWARPAASLRALAEVLRVNGGDRTRLLRLLTLNTLLGNTDAHAKNYSFVHLPDGRLDLAPAYDVSPHAQRGGGGRVALFVNGKSRTSTITLDDVVAEGVAFGLAHRSALGVVTEVRERLVDFLDDLSDDDVHELSRPSFEWVAENVAALPSPTSGTTALLAPSRPRPVSRTLDRCGAATSATTTCRNPTNGSSCWRHA